MASRKRKATAEPDVSQTNGEKANVLSRERRSARTLRKLDAVPHDQLNQDNGTSAQLESRKRAAPEKKKPRSDPGNRRNKKTISDNPPKQEAELLNPKGSHNRSIETNGGTSPEIISYWLMKAEPESRIEKGVDVKFSIDDLAACTRPEAWDGVRNYVARNHMRAMKKGDLALFYHSNCKTPGVVGTMEIVREASVDQTAFESTHPYYDSKDSPEKGKWSVVHVEFRKKFAREISLSELKSHATNDGALANLMTLKQSRLSVSSVSSEEWDFILSLAEKQDQS